MARSALLSLIKCWSFRTAAFLPATISTADSEVKKSSKKCYNVLFEYETFSLNVYVMFFLHSEAVNLQVTDIVLF